MLHCSGLPSPERNACAIGGMLGMVVRLLTGSGTDWPPPGRQGVNLHELHRTAPLYPAVPRFQQVTVLKGPDWGSRGSWVRIPPSRRLAFSVLVWITR